MSSTIDIVQVALGEAVADIRANLEKTGTNASGRTSRSLRVEVKGNGEHIEGIIWGRAAFDTVETGRRRGRVPRGFIDIIKEWITDKGIAVQPIPYKRQASARWQPKYTPQERGLNSLAGAIAHKIKTEGSKLYRDGGREDIIAPVVDKLTKTLKNELIYHIIELSRNGNTSN